MKFLCWFGLHKMIMLQEPWLWKCWRCGKTDNFLENDPELERLASKKGND